MYLADTVIDPRAEADIIWYYQSADGEMGMKSSFPAMVARLQVGGPTVVYAAFGPDARCLDAAARARRIKRGIERLSAQQRRVVYAAFGPDARSLPGLGTLAPIAELTEAGKAAFRASGTTHSFGEWLVRLCSRCTRPAPSRSKKKRAAAEKATNDDRRTLALIQAQADVLLRQSLHSFAAVRRGRR